MGADAVVKVISPPVVVRDLTVPSVPRCGLMIFALKATLTIRGFAWTVGWIRHRVEAVRKRESPPLNALKATERAVAIAGALYPGRALCLEQSLVLYYVLRRQGVPVNYRHGVQPHPFEAHAWVEYQGEPINDVVEHAKLFTCLPDLLP